MLANTCSSAIFPACSIIHRILAMASNDRWDAHACCSASVMNISASSIVRCSRHDQSPSVVFRHLQIKAWCYYKSRVLGGHRGLLSSYALEILVLHICNIHHATINTPLEARLLFLYTSYAHWDPNAVLRIMCCTVIVSSSVWPAGLSCLCVVALDVASEL